MESLAQRQNTQFKSAIMLIFENLVGSELENPYFNGGSFPGFHVLQGIAVTSNLGPLAIPQ
jgi:hypothetical protein